MADLPSWLGGPSYQAGRRTVVSDSITGEFPPNSNFRQDKVDKTTNLAVNTAQPNDIAKTQSVRLNDGVLAPDTMIASNIHPADYYRRGKKKQIDPTFVGPPNPFDATKYDYSPRNLPDPDEETIASLRLIGKVQVNSKSEDVDLIPPYSKFFLESYQEGHMERSQIVETFGEFYAFFFGERPPVYTFAGTLLNTTEINWKEDFMFYYDKFLRGTKAVEYKAKVVLTYNLSQVEGYILGVSTQSQAANDKGVGVSFQMLVTKRRTMKLSVDFGVIESSNGAFNQDPSILNLLTLGLSDPSVNQAYVDTVLVNQGLSPAAAASQVTPSEADQVANVISNPFTIGKGKAFLT